MTLRFNADELFEIAEKIEKNGARFYRKAAEQQSNPEVTELLNNLASMEEEHQIVFATMRANLDTDEPEKTVFDPDEQVANYLAAIADGNVFDLKSDPAELLTKDISLKDILHLSIGFEKDSIIFYLGMLDMIPERFGRDNIHNIINEEKKHITQLAGKLAELKKT